MATPYNADAINYDVKWEVRKKKVSLIRIPALPAGRCNPNVTVADLKFVLIKYGIANPRTAEKYFYHRIKPI